MIPNYFYLNESEEILLYRRIKEGGDTFVNNYLEQFSERESDSNFTLRKRMTPSAAFAKKEVMGVNNAIYQRLTDIIRIGGSDSYQNVVAGKDGGIDLDDSSLTHFIGQDVLSELLFMGVVGVFVDMPAFTGSSIAETAKHHPYCYIYTREQILNYAEDQVNNRKTITALKLVEYTPILDEFGLPNGDERRFRVYNLLENGVRVRFLDSKENVVDDYILDLPEIPFTILQLPNSLLHETGKYQVALMNLESSDNNYALRSNFQFYVEQASIQRGIHLNDNDDEIEVGNVQGRTYSGDKPPEFIHPSPEPLEVSMKKQEQIKDSIKQQINLAVSSVVQKSADSKSMDERGLESGLSAIGEILEQGERKIAIYYSNYEGTSEIATINYPDKYTLKSDKELIEEVRLIQDQKEEMPSLKGKKALAKLAAHKLFDTRLPVEDIKIIINEIETSNNVGAPAKTVVADVEAGILSHETAATMRGYEKSEAKKAETEHAERLARIEEAQTRARENTMAAARGVDDKAPDAQDAKEEKQESQDPNLNGDGKKLVRGEQK